MRPVHVSGIVLGEGNVGQGDSGLFGRLPLTVIPDEQKVASFPYVPFVRSVGGPCDVSPP